MITAKVKTPGKPKYGKIILPVDKGQVKLKNYISSGQVVDYFEPSCMVNDVFRGEFAVKPNGNIIYSVNQERHSDFSLSSFNDQPATENTNAVVLILESPHRYEYKLVRDVSGESRILPRGPAQGNAGSGIKKHILEIVKSTNSLTPGTYPFLIVNPIPYQTSLFHLLGKTKIDVDLRNEVWIRLWRLKPIRDYFAQRLDHYQPTLIINACTTPACCYVTDFLFQAGYKDIVFRCMHPSYNWNVGRRSVWPASLDSH